MTPPSSASAASASGPPLQRVIAWARANRATLAVVLPAVLLLWLPYRVGYQRSWWRAESLDAYQALIPIGAIAMAWIRVPYLQYLLRSRRIKTPAKPGGPLLMFFGCALWLINHLWHYQELSALSVFVVASGTVYYLYGARGLTAMSSPLLFLLLMAPLPRLLSNRLSLMLQLNTTFAAGTILRVIGAPVKIVGNTLLLPHYRLDVTEACGGAGILLGLLVLTVWLLGMMQSTPYKQVMLFLVAILLELPLNILRIVAMGLIGLLNPRLAAALHDANSWIFTLLLFALMFKISHWMKIRHLWSAPIV
jgi:exosortase